MSETDTLMALLERADQIILHHSTLDPALVERSLRVRSHVMAVKLYEVMESFNANLDFSRHDRLAVDVWLLSQILYYRHSMPVLTDAAYDALCRYLLDHHDRLVAADASYTMITRNHLDCGSGEDLIDQMPQMIRLAARSYP